MRTRSYLILGLIIIFATCAFIIAVDDVPALGSVLVGIGILLVIPLIVLMVRKVPKRTYKHQNKEDNFDGNNNKEG